MIFFLEDQSFFMALADGIIFSGSFLCVLPLMERAGEPKKVFFFGFLPITIFLMVAVLLLRFI